PEIQLAGDVHPDGAEPDVRRIARQPRRPGVRVDVRSSVTSELFGQGDLWSETTLEAYPQPRSAMRRSDVMTCTVAGRRLMTKIPTSIQQFIDDQADAAPAKYDDLRVVVFNGSLKRSPEPSHTDALLAIPP